MTDTLFPQKKLFECHENDKQIDCERDQFSIYTK